MNVTGNAQFLTNRSDEILIVSIIFYNYNRIRYKQFFFHDTFLVFPNDFHVQVNPCNLQSNILIFTIVLATPTLYIQGKI